MLAVQHAGGIVAVEERPVGAIDADDLLGLDAMPEGKPTLIGEDGQRAAADARRRHRIGVGAEAGRAMRLPVQRVGRSEEHTSELQSIMRISYAVFCLKKNKLKDRDSEYVM